MAAGHSSCHWPCMAAVGEAGADRFRPHAEALSSLGVTLEGARDASEEMLSDALSSVGISLEEVRREAGDVFDMSIPDERRVPFSLRAKKPEQGSAGCSSRCL